MADKITGSVRVEETLGLTMVAGDNLVIKILGSTGLEKQVLYDGYVPDYNELSGSIVLSASLVASAPVIESMSASASYIGPSGTVTITCVASDPADLPLTYTFSANGSITDVSPGIVDWEVPDAIGVTQIQCEVENTNGAKTTAALNINVFSAPTITSLVADPSSVSAWESSTITCTATDDYTSSLFFRWSTTTGYVVGDGYQIIWTAPGVTGSYPITCQAFEAAGATYAEETVYVDVV